MNHPRVNTSFLNIPEINLGELAPPRPSVPMRDPSRMSLLKERQAQLFSLAKYREPHPLPTLKTSGRATVAKIPPPAPRRVPPSTPGPDKSVCSPGFAPQTLTKSRVGASAWFLRRSGCQDERHQSGQEEETLPHVPVHHLSG